MGGWNKGIWKHDAEEICRLYREGKSMTQIAEMFSTTASTVFSYLKRCGVTTRSISTAIHMRRGGNINQDKKGYLLKNMAIGKRKKLHRLIMEQHLGRTLKKKRSSASYRWR